MKIAWINRLVVWLMAFSLANIAYGQPIMADKQIGLVSFTFRRDFSTDMPATLKKIRELGIVDVEFSNLFGYEAGALRKLLDSHGISCSSFGVSYEELMSNTHTVAENALHLGAKYVRVASIPRQDGMFALGDAQKAVTDFNRVGKILKEQFGLVFIYHNHGFEFVPYENRTLYDYLMENTEPVYVSFELDILWAFFPGQNPVALLEKYGPRYKALHLKDLRKGVVGDLSGKTPKANDVALGTGQLDIPTILKVAKRFGINHFYIEDESDRIDKQVPQSIAYLKQLVY